MEIQRTSVPPASTMPTRSLAMVSPTLANRTSRSSGYEGSVGTSMDRIRTPEASDWTKATRLPSGLHAARPLETDWAVVWVSRVV